MKKMLNNDRNKLLKSFKYFKCLAQYLFSLSDHLSENKSLWNLIASLYSPSLKLQAESLLFAAVLLLLQPMHTEEVDPVFQIGGLNYTLMVGTWGSSAGSYLANPTSPIPSQCAVTCTGYDIHFFTHLILQAMTWNKISATKTLEGFCL